MSDKTGVQVVTFLVVFSPPTAHGKAKTPLTKLGKRNPDVRLWLFIEQSIWFRITICEKLLNIQTHSIDLIS